MVHKEQNIGALTLFSGRYSAEWMAWKLPGFGQQRLINKKDRNGFWHGAEPKKLQHVIMTSFDFDTGMQRTPSNGIQRGHPNPNPSILLHKGGYSRLSTQNEAYIYHIYHHSWIEFGNVGHFWMCFSSSFVSPDSYYASWMQDDMRHGALGLPPFLAAHREIRSHQADS